MIRIFIEGGFLIMGVLTLELIALLLAAWKAPGWVKEIGLLALVTGPVWFMRGFYMAASAIAQAGDIAPSLLWSGVRVTLISLIYGCLIYALSLIIRIVQKPRLL